MLRLLPLVLGAFAIGAETFLVSGVLPQIAADLRVSAAAAGSLVTIFALAYAFGSPLIAVATAGVERKRLLIVAIGAFALANLVAAFAPNFLSLAAARALLALVRRHIHAGGGRLRHRALLRRTARPGDRDGLRRHDARDRHRRAGRHLSRPLAGWRAPFFGVAVVAALAVIGVATVLPRLQGARAAGFAERLAVMRRPDVLQMLTLTALALVGPFALNTFLGVLVEAALGVGGDRLALVLAFFGVVSFVGSQFGGYAADRWPRERFLAVVFVVLIVAFPLMSVGPQLGGEAGAALLFAGLALWGVFGWAFPIVQQARLVTPRPGAGADHAVAQHLGALCRRRDRLVARRLGARALVGRRARLVAGASEIVALAWLALARAPKAARESQGRAEIAKAQIEPML